MEDTVFGLALEGMNHVKSQEGVMLTKQFLDVCKLIIPVIEKFGAAMALVKSDVGTIHFVIGAIAAGNAVVLKPSEVAPATSSMLPDFSSMILPQEKNIGKKLKSCTAIDSCAASRKQLKILKY